MKLAEALNLRADIHRRIERLRQRLSQNARVQEGERSPEDPAELLKELDALTGELEELIVKINLANAKTTVGNKTLTELIAHRDVLDSKLNVLRSFMNEASALAPRGMKTEIKLLANTDVSALRKQIDCLEKERRETDTAIQSANWTAEI